MSFLKSLFGGKGGERSGAAKAGATEEYNGFVIRAAPQAQGGEHILAGSVEKEIGGELKSHTFIRADRFSSRDDAEAAALRKGKQLVDEQGDRLFS